MDEAADPSPAEWEPVRYAHKPVGRNPGAQRLGEQGTKVAKVPRDYRPLLFRKRSEVHTVGAPAELGSLRHGDDVMAAVAKSAGDLGREVLVEQKPQGWSASWAARQVASSRSLSVRLRAIQSSISSRFEP